MMGNNEDFRDKITLNAIGIIFRCTAIIFTFIWFIWKYWDDIVAFWANIINQI